jgi:hypothetical protein
LLYTTNLSATLPVNSDSGAQQFQYWKFQYQAQREVGMKRKLIFLVGAAAFIQPAVVLAQGQSLASVGFKCSDFQKNQDGTWSPTHTVTLPAGGARISLSPKDSIKPGASVAGYPLGALLDAGCGGH